MMIDCTMEMIMNMITKKKIRRWKLGEDLKSQSETENSGKFEFTSFFDSLNMYVSNTKL